MTASDVNKHLCFPPVLWVQTSHFFSLVKKSNENNSHHKKDDIHQKQEQKAGAPKAAASAGPSKTEEKVKTALEEARNLNAQLEASKALTKELEGKVRIAWETVEELSAAK